MNDNITGFDYTDSFITDAEEETLLTAIQSMPLASLKMRGKISERHRELRTLLRRATS